MLRNVGSRRNPVTCLVGISLQSDDRFVAMSSRVCTSALGRDLPVATESPMTLEGLKLILVHLK